MASFTRIIVDPETGYVTGCIVVDETSPPPEEGVEFYHVSEDYYAGPGMIRTSKDPLRLEWPPEEPPEDPDAGDF